jgi:hypothetical protein
MEGTGLKVKRGRGYTYSICRGGGVTLHLPEGKPWWIFTYRVRKSNHRNVLGDICLWDSHGESEYFTQCGGKPSGECAGNRGGKQGNLGDGKGRK